MKLHCPECTSLVKAAAIDLFAGQADCLDCERSFPFEPLLRRPRATSRQRPAAAHPAGFERQANSKTLQIGWGCQEPVKMILFFGFGLIWDLALAGAYARFLSAGDPFWTTLTLIVTLPHLLAGLFFFYFPLAALLGRTAISASPLELRVTHGPLPLPWLGRRIATAEIAQLFCRPRKRYRASDQADYDLCVWLTNGHEVLLARLNEAQQAIWSEQQIEAHLGIRDRAVAGEVLG